MTLLGRWVRCSADGAEMTEIADRSARYVSVEADALEIPDARQH